MSDEEYIRARLDQLETRLRRVEKIVQSWREYSDPTKSNERQGAGAFEILNPAREIKWH